MRQGVPIKKLITLISPFILNMIPLGSLRCMKYLPMNPPMFAGAADVRIKIALFLFLLFPFPFHIAFSTMKLPSPQRSVNR